MSGSTTDWYDPNLFGGMNTASQPNPGHFESNPNTLGGILGALGQSAMTGIGMMSSFAGPLAPLGMLNIGTSLETGKPPGISTTLGAIADYFGLGGAPSTAAVNAGDDEANAAGAASNPNVGGFAGVDAPSLAGRDTDSNAAGAASNPNVGGTAVETVGYAKGGKVAPHHRHVVGALAHLIARNPDHPVLGALGRAALTHYAMGGRV